MATLDGTVYHPTATLFSFFYIFARIFPSFFLSFDFYFPFSFFRSYSLSFKWISYLFTQTKGRCIKGTSMAVGSFSSVVPAMAYAVGLYSIANSKQVWDSCCLVNVFYSYTLLWVRYIFFLRENFQILVLENTPSSLIFLAAYYRKLIWIFHKNQGKFRWEDAKGQSIAIGAGFGWTALF